MSSRRCWAATVAAAVLTAGLLSGARRIVGAISASRGTVTWPTEAEE
jgi:hypothetical protein